jgi:hypothetical protein
MEIYAPSLGTNGLELAKNCNPNILKYQDFQPAYRRQVENPYNN